jgi:hypothetical protein
VRALKICLPCPTQPALEHLNASTVFAAIPLLQHTLRAISLASKHAFETTRFGRANSQPWPFAKVDRPGWTD